MAPRVRKPLHVGSDVFDFTYISHLCATKSFPRLALLDEYIRQLGDITMIQLMMLHATGQNIVSVSVNL